MSAETAAPARARKTPPWCRPPVAAPAPFQSAPEAWRSSPCPVFLLTVRVIYIPQQVPKSQRDPPPQRLPNNGISLCRSHNAHEAPAGRSLLPIPCLPQDRRHLTARHACRRALRDTSQHAVQSIQGVRVSGEILNNPVLEVLNVGLPSRRELHVVGRRRHARALLQLHTVMVLTANAAALVVVAGGNPTNCRAPALGLSCIPCRWQHRRQNTRPSLHASGQN